MIGATYHRTPNAESSDIDTWLRLRFTFPANLTPVSDTTSSATSPGSRRLIIRLPTSEDIGRGLVDRGKKEMPVHHVRHLVPRPRDRQLVDVEIRR